MSSSGAGGADSFPGEQIAILGTGRMGSALALRFGSGGFTIALGSRSPERANAKAEALCTEIGARRIWGADYLTAVQSSQVVVLAVPYLAQQQTLRQVGPLLNGKILVVANVALNPAAFDEVHLPPGSSAALQAQAQLGANVPVVAAFQTTMYRSLLDLTKPVEGDIFVAGDDLSACQRVMDLAGRAGMRTWHIGPLVNSIAAEALTSVLIYLGIANDSKVTGIRVTGVERSD